MKEAEQILKSRRVRMGLMLLVIYLPFAWLLFVSESLDCAPTWIKMWPILPGPWDQRFDEADSWLNAFVAGGKKLCLSAFVAVDHRPYLLLGSSSAGILASLSCWGDTCIRRVQLDCLRSDESVTTVTQPMPLTIIAGGPTVQTILHYNGAPMDLPLNTPRLVLRRFTDSDVQSFCAYRNDPEVAAFQDWTECSLIEARAFIDWQKRLASAVPGQWFQIAVALKETGQLIGDCGFRLDAGEPCQATVGITFSTQYQGRGLATEALSALVDYLLIALELRRVRADTDAQNIRCSRLLQRVGFRREGHLVQSLRFKGRWADEYLYAVLRDEWLQQRGTA